jgi:aquaporin related protein
MSGEGPSELPQQYGSKPLDGEVIRRPVTPPIISSPRRPYNPNPRAYSPERTPIDIYQYTGDQEPPRTSGGLRRRPSGGVPQQRGWSQGESDREQPAFAAIDTGSRKQLRSTDDTYFRSDDEYDRYYPPRAHPDQFEKSRPPRTYRNVEGWEKGPSSATKPFFDESKSEYGRERDLERGEEPPYSCRKRSGISTEESIDGYDYERAKRNGMKIDFKSLSREEKAEVMRLPFLQWMNSDFKNRKS